MQSLKSKFNGNKGEVIEYTRVWGRFKAMEKFGVRDYIAFSKFIQEETEDEIFGLHPLLHEADNTLDLKHLLLTITDTISTLRKERDEAREQLKQERLKTEYLRTQQALEIEPLLQAVMAECQT